LQKIPYQSDNLLDTAQRLEAETDPLKRSCIYAVFSSDVGPLLTKAVMWYIIAERGKITDMILKRMRFWINVMLNNLPRNALIA
jgi:hypothetical protein